MSRKRASDVDHSSRGDTLEARDSATSSRYSSSAEFNRIYLYQSGLSVSICLLTTLLFVEGLGLRVAAIGRPWKDFIAWATSSAASHPQQTPPLAVQSIFRTDRAAANERRLEFYDALL